jgi:hypothetical protein
MGTAFFLGANTSRGFVSHYGTWLDYDKLKRLYIIKGTPGNGKSGFMRRVVKKLGEAAAGHEYIFCSADPSSLDGVYLPKPGVAFVDGTTPHAVEPQYPMAVDCYLPLTQFVNDEALLPERGAIVALKDGLREEYSRLYRILTAVQSLRDERRNIVSAPETLEAILRRVPGVIKREIKKGGGGKVHKRFLSALTPGGGVTLWQTVDAMADRVYELEDSYGLADIFLRPLLEAAEVAGLESYACYDPLDSSDRISHLLLPELKLAFVSSPYPGEPFRRFRLDAAIHPELIAARRMRLRFLKKAESALFGDACGVLGKSLEKHSLLEDTYNPHIDFGGVRALADAYAENIAAQYQG